MKNFLKKGSISGLAALLLFCVFAIGILSVLLSGAGAYRRLTLRDSRSYDSRTCAQYVATKLRQAPGPESVELAPFGEGDALYIYQEIGGELYLTRIYCHEGWLMELFTAAETEMEPQDGEKILQAQSMALRLEQDLLGLSIVDGSGSPIQLQLSLRGREGAAA